MLRTVDCMDKVKISAIITRIHLDQQHLSLDEIYKQNPYSFDGLSLKHYLDNCM